MAERVYTETKDWTLSTLKEMCDGGEIIPNPDYQRDYVYTQKQASRLIESILMGIPIPTVYLCQEDDECYSVIDGQQRITSFVRYLKNEFSISNLKEISDLNGKKFMELDRSIQTKLRTSCLHVICILKESQELKYEIFSRLNQGAVSLNSQELRNCIYRGRFNEMLNTLSKNRWLPTLFKDENKRYGYQERILRFFALRNYSEYKSSMLKTMNYFMFKNRNIADDDYNEMTSLFNNTIDAIKQVLGNDAFVMLERDGKKSHKFSGSIFDSIMIPFSFFEKRELIGHADDIRNAIENIKKSDNQYREDTYAASGSKKRVIGRIVKIYNAIASIVGNSSRAEECRAYSTEIKVALFNKSNICAVCHNEILSIDDAEVDHITPYSRGGSTDISNAQLLHRTCNRQKSDSTDDDFEEES